MSSGNSLELRRISKMRGGRQVLSEISLLVEPGQNLTILGPSGSGKTSLLRLCNCLDTPDSGQVLLGGVDVKGQDVIELRRRVAMVFQAPTMFDGTVRYNVGYGPRLAGEQAEPEELLRLVGLNNALLDRPAAELSVGQKQRVELARALANKPEVLLMDEPTSGLDIASANRILDLVSDLKQRLGVTVLFVTHLLEQAQRLADRVGLLVEGRLHKVEEKALFFSRDLTELHSLFEEQ
jgi:putative ABC transport system ATP-binding protein